MKVRDRTKGSNMSMKRKSTGMPANNELHTMQTRDWQGNRRWLLTRKGMESILGKITAMFRNDMKVSPQSTYCEH